MTVQRNTFLAVTVYYWSILIIYNLFILDSIYSRSINIPVFSFSHDFIVLFFGYTISLIGINQLKFSNRPSSIIYIYLYLSTLIPSIIFILISNTDIFDKTIQTFAIYLAFYSLNISRSFKAIEISIKKDGRIFFIFFFVLLTASMMSYLYITKSFNFKDFSFFDVYEKRGLLREEFLSGSSTMKFYFTNWIGMVIAPALVSFACVKRKWFILILALGLSGFAFAASSQKSHFFLSIIIISIYFSLRLMKKKKRNISAADFIIIFTFIFVIIPGFIDFIFLPKLAPFTSFITSFRLLLNNGFLTSSYFELFKEEPFLLYADSFLRSFVESPFDQSYSRMAGDFISTYENSNNANANLFADGYVNLGYIGIFFAAMQCTFIMYCIDCVALNKNKLIVTLLLIPFCFSISNAPVHTSMVSSGGILLIFIIILMPSADKTKEDI